MKKLIAVLSVLLVAIFALSACTPEVEIKIDPNKQQYVVGICQIVQHEALDSATKGFKDALTEELQKAGRTVVFKEQNAQNEPTLCTTIINQFVNDDVDLILANATPVLQAAANATLNIPILGTSITEYGVALNIPDFDGVVGGNISGTSDLAPLDEQANMITTLVPNATKVGLVYCSAEPNSKYQVEEVARLLTQKGLTCKLYSFTDSNDAPTVANKAAQESDVMYVPTDNTVASNAAIFENASKQHRTPIVAGEEGVCRGCGIATLSISYYNLGKVTGQMAAKVLLGQEDISKMQVGYDAQPVFKFNRELCEFFGITVPANYVEI